MSEANFVFRSRGFGLRCEDFIWETSTRQKRYFIVSPSRKFHCAVCVALILSIQLSIGIRQFLY